MTPCSFYTDDRTAVSRTACSAHGDCSPSECAAKLRKELDTALAKPGFDKRDACLRELGSALIYMRWLRPDWRESKPGKEQYRRVKLLCKEFAVNNHRYGDTAWWESFLERITEETENLC